MKRIFSMILALALVIACLPDFQLEVHAVTTVASGECGKEGDNVNWTLDDAGTLTISGTGRMENYTYTYLAAPWYDYRSAIKTVVIENGVTRIGECAFYTCYSLTSVTIPDSVTTIGKSAFAGCSSLTSVTIPDSVTSIGSGAFVSCGRLTSVAIPDSVTSLGSGVFSDCHSLTSVTIPDSVTSLGSGVFSLCRSLTSVTIPDSVTDIGESAFSSCDNLISVTIPDSVTTIGKSAFSSCTSLTGVTIPDSVTSIASRTFSYCTSLTSVTIPDSVTTIGEHAFADCSGLTSVTIPDSVTSIGDWAFYRCSSLTSVTIPDSVTSIASRTFSYCTSLTSVTIPDSVTTIGEHAFADCSGLTSVTIPDSVTTIGEYAFCYCENLTSVTIPDSVTSIGGDVFYGGDLREIIFMGSAPSISEDAFEDVTATAYYPADDATWTEDVRQNYGGTITWVPYGDDSSDPNSGKCGDNVYWKYEDSTLTISGTGAMYDYTTAVEPKPWYGLDITYVVIEDGVTHVGAYAFYDTDMFYVTIGDTVTSIGEWTFANNYGLWQVTIGNSVETIGDGAFAACLSLSDIVIPDSVKVIGISAFAECDLENVTIGDTVTSIGKWAFENCSFSEIVIPASVTSIGDEAFTDNEHMQKITFEGDAPSFGTDVFGGIYEVEAEAYYPGNNTTWTADKRQQYGGKITWIPYGSEEIDNIMATGTCGANLTWKLTEDGVLTISGTGDMTDYSLDPLPVPWYGYKEIITSVVIENGVTSIGGAAFWGGFSLTSVTIPASVTNIVGNPFAGTTRLTEVKVDKNNPNYSIDQSGVLFNKDKTTLVICPSGNTGEYIIPDSVTSIGDSAFSGCSSLTSVTITNSVTSIDRDAFCGCSSLTSVTIPNSVTSIGPWAFGWCDSLTSVTIGKSVTSIGWYAFCYTSLKEITFKGSAPTIGNDAFYSVRATAYFYVDDTWTEDVTQNYGGNITWIAVEKDKLLLNGEDFADQDTVWIEGLPYPVQGESNDRYVELPTEEDCYMVTYTYHVGDAADVHTQYPTGMKVYKVSGSEITHIPELDNLLQYSGASIRITGKKGIRMITSLNKETKNALTGKGLAGFKLLEYGTALCFASEIQDGDALVLGRDFTRSNYAYKKGVADPVFASTKDLIQYTNVLVGFSLDQCKDDIAMRPYIILEDAAGNQITLYGGTIYRSIGYIAYQNRTVFKPKTASYNYVWELIHHVYGDKYDADYKG